MIIKEREDGLFHTAEVDGEVTTLSMPFEKHSDRYNELVSEGIKVELLADSVKAAQAEQEILQALESHIHKECLKKGYNFESLGVYASSTETKYAQEATDLIEMATQCWQYFEDQKALVESGEPMPTVEEFKSGLVTYDQVKTNQTTQ